VPCTPEVLDAFNNARVYTVTSFAADHRIDISPNAVSQFKIFRTPSPLYERLRDGALAMSLSAGGSNGAFHAMMNASAQHVHLANAPVASELLVPWLGLLSGGAYFPTIHWDTDWLQFPTAPGFQLWCMHRTHITEMREGSIFLVTSSNIDAHDPPVRFVWNEDGSMTKLRHTEDRPEYPLQGYASVHDANLSFHYMHLEAGECLIWSKRTLHMSDPRPHLRGGTNERSAAHLRVAVRAHPGAALDYWPNHPYAREYGTFMWRLKRKSTHMVRTGGYHQLFVDGDELIERNSR